MSHLEEDTELRDLVTEALEKNGVLAAVRAHLRAGVFLALEREHEQRPKDVVDQLLNSHDGFLTLLLVQDFLDFCQLRHTSSVYRAETGQPYSFSYNGREATVKDYQLDGLVKSSNLPLLVQLVSVILTMLKSKTKSDAAVGVPEGNTYVVNHSDDYDTTFTSDSSSRATFEEKIEPKDIPELSLSTDSNSSEDLVLRDDIESKKSDSVISDGDNQTEIDKKVDENGTIDTDVPSNSTHSKIIRNYSISDVSIKENLDLSKIKEPLQDSGSHNTSQFSNRSDVIEESVKESIRTDSIVEDIKTNDAHIGKSLIDDVNSKHNSISESVGSVTFQNEHVETTSDTPSSLLDESIPESPRSKINAIRHVDSLKSWSIDINGSSSRSESKDSTAGPPVRRIELADLSISDISSFDSSAHLDGISKEKKSNSSTGHKINDSHASIVNGLE